MISIITPHRNDITGLNNILKCLKAQTSNLYEWVVVDDFSEREQIQQFKESIKSLKINNIKVICNDENSGPSFCRNLGVSYSTYERLVFLDSDDTIAPNFIKNRLGKLQDFAVFSNMMMENSVNQTQQRFSKIKSDYLNNFLKAKFVWQTTAVLWNKDFFNAIGGFNENLILLEDIELIIRALLKGKQYEIYTDNEVDFYYLVKPINIKSRTFKKVANSVEILINSILKTNLMVKSQSGFLKSYYFLAVRYFVKSNDYKHDFYVLSKLLKAFKKNNLITWLSFVIAYITNHFICFVNLL